MASPLGEPSAVRPIHTSDRIAYKRCRRGWDYSSPLRWHLEPNIPSLELWFGTGIHFALEDHHGYKRFAYPEVALEAYLAAFPEEERPTGAEDQIEVGLGMLGHYQQWYTARNEFRTMYVEGVPQVEVHFSIQMEGLPSDVVYQGTFDRVVEDIFGDLWVIDYKTTKSFDLSKLETDSQISSYAWAADVWYKRPIAGMILLQLVKDTPHLPYILKNGDFCQDKRQNTTHYLYQQALLDKFGKVPKKYEAYLAFLVEQQTLEGDKFIRWDKVVRNDDFKRATYKHIIAEAQEMLSPNIAIYPNSTRDCIWDCAFRSSCLATDDGSDAAFMLQEEFRLRGDEDKWRKRIKWPMAA